ncbi:MAG TPA: hypothetical protein VH063_11890 [Gaiellaceae bacterium]|jgi:hypothetical protein|nr:hypothetical protein [Gaiellaceae bacterium]
MGRCCAVAVAALCFLVAAGAAAAASPEEQLIAKYAPITRLVEQKHVCGAGEPYRPIDVSTLFGQDTVALRGPWNTNDLVKIGPTRKDLGAGLPGYHLDFPGSPLAPGCGYELWERRITRGTKPTIYGHIAKQRTFPNSLALQYWFFYVFNDFNNTHEGDWEMIQLNFDAATPKQALAENPTEVGYSQHESAERAKWGDPKLELLDGTHPVVYVASGSHANFYDPALFLGRSASEGVGCDDTRGPHTEITPAVRTIPMNPVLAREVFPWIAFEGRWGELQPAFFNGPTGPNDKNQWTWPITWSQGWRAHSYAIPAGGALGTSTTDYFCGAVARSSNLLRRLVHHPFRILLILVGLTVLLTWLASRTSWRPTAPLHIARRRSWGQTVAASWRMYARRPLLFLGIGLATIPISIVVTLLQAAILNASTFVGLSKAGEGGADRGWILLVIGTLLTLAGMTLVQAAAARAMVELDAGRPVGVLQAYRLALRNARALLGALAVAVPIVTVFTASLVLIPVALVLATTWALIVPCAELETRPGLAVLRRSGSLVLRCPFKVLTLVVGGAALVLVIGPIVGGLVLLATSASFAFVNLVAGIVYAIFMPVVGIATTYVYFDALVREHEAAATSASGVLPAELPT